MARQQRVESQLPIRKSPEALAMIRKESLEAIVAAAEGAAREISDTGVPVDRVDIERVVDPEIEGLVLLGITVWMPDTAVDQASAAWDRLLDLARSRVTELGPEEMRKLSELVSIGVDLE